MHILYIHQHFTTPRVGGATRSYEFARRFAAAGHEVTVLAGRPLDAEVIAQELPAGVRVINAATPYENRMSSLERVLSFLRFATRATSSGWRVRPDVIYATSTPLTVALPALVLSRRWRVPFVFEVRDLWPEAPIQMEALRSPALIRLLRAFERYVYRRAAHVVALSPGMMAGVVGTGVATAKVSMIPNAADIALFRPGPLDPAFLRARGLPERPTVAYAGALGAANAVELLGDAAIRLQNRGSDAQIVVAGDGKRSKDLAELVRSHALRNLVLLGRAPKSDVVGLYRAASAGLVLFRDLPVLQTNSPNKFFDLLAAGRPVITNMRGWIRDLVQEERIGFAVAPTDPDGVADAIDAACSGEDFAVMAANARALAEREFARDEIAERIEAVLARAAGVARVVA